MTFLYEKVNSGWINKDQVDNFVKYLKLVQNFTEFFIRTNHRHQETKVLDLM